MEIKTKFDLWQEVWIIVGGRDNECALSTPRMIREIHITNYCDDVRISYTCSDTTGHVCEDCVFKTKKEAEIACAKLKQKRLAEKLAEVTTHLRELEGE